MDMQTMLNNAVEAGRAKEMKTSDQLVLGELILKLEAIKNNKLPVYFDYKNYKPIGLDSWRGSYCELAIEYNKKDRRDDGGSSCYEQMKDTCKKDEFNDHHFQCECGGSKEYETTLPKNPTVNDLLKVLKLVMGKYFIGYKGGDFTMGKTTPVWVSNYGENGGFERDKDNYSTYIIDVEKKKDKVLLITKDDNY